MMLSFHYMLALTTFLNMAIISVRASSDLPVSSDYIPLIGLFFFLSQLYTFISFVWFAACNYLKSIEKLPIFFKKLAKFLIKHAGSADNKEKEMNALNHFALFLMGLAIFVSYLTIWLIISN